MWRRLVLVAVSVGFRLLLVPSPGLYGFRRSGRYRRRLIWRWSLCMAKDIFRRLVIGRAWACLSGLAGSAGVGFRLLSAGWILCLGVGFVLCGLWCGWNLEL